MAQLYDQATGDQLLANGSISQDQYDRMYPPVQPTPTAQPAPIPEPIPAPPMKPSGGQFGGVGSTASFAPEAPPQVVPAAIGMPPETVPAQPGVVSQAVDGIQQGYEMQQMGLAKAVEEGQKIAAKESAYLDQIQRDDLVRIKEQEEMQIQEQARIDEQNKKIDSAVTEFSSMKVDPKRYWKNMDTGDRILAGIGMFLGSFGSASTNQAVDVIQKSIDKDIEAQKEEIESKKGVVNAQRGILGDMMQRFSNQRDAKNASRLAYLNNAQLKVKQFELSTNNANVKANAQQLFGQLEVAKNKTLLELQTSLMAKQTPGGDAITQDIFNRVPKDFQGKAFEEKGLVDEWNRLTDDVLSTYKSLNNQGVVSGTLPGAIGGNRESYIASKAKLSGAIVGKVKGIKSDSDFVKIVEPMLPAPTDTPGQAALKLTNFTAFMKANAPSAPILEGFGLRPKTLTEKAPSLKPL